MFYKIKEREWELGSEKPFEYGPVELKQITTTLKSIKYIAINTYASKTLLWYLLPDPLKMKTLSLNSALSSLVRRESREESLSSKLMMATSSFLAKSRFAFVLSKAVLPVPKSEMKMTFFFLSSFRSVY
jgi:hypothetical protein